MNISSRIIKNYGESITIDGCGAKGFISVIDENKPDMQRRIFPAGVKNTLLYRLITDFPAPSEGMSVCCGDIRYVIFRVEKVTVFGKLSHYECILGAYGGESADV